MKKYRKKPVIIEALQFDGNNEIQIMDFIGQKLHVSKPPQGMEHDKEVPDEVYRIIIPTLEGDMVCQRWDFVIKGIKGEFYPCKPDIFKLTYEEAI